MYGACSLFLAAGLARPIGNAVVRRGLCSRPKRPILAILGLLIVLAALSSGRRAVKESRGGRFAIGASRCP